MYDAHRMQVLQRDENLVEKKILQEIKGNKQTFLHQLYLSVHNIQYIKQEIPVAQKQGFKKEL